MNIIVLGTTEFTLCCAKGIIDSKQNISAIISRPASFLPLNSADIHGFASKYNIPYHEIDDINSLYSLDILRNYAPDFIFSSWPRMLKQSVLDIPKRYVIGTHPTDLPFNRGRHPLHWLIVLGISQTKLSFFHMDQNVDTGKLLLQIPIEIDPEDSINDLLTRVNGAAYEGTILLWRKLLEEQSYEGIEQNHIAANYWRKRTPHDITIDFRMLSHNIVSIVRSFNGPYPCANVIFENHILKIDSASTPSITETPNELKRIEPGKIISINGRNIVIKAADNIVELTCKGELPSALLHGKYIHPPSKYIIKWAEELKQFFE
jgi:methionyl-tRNA formyltransferase